MRAVVVSTLAGLLAAGFSGAAAAQDWNFEVTPYIWVAFPDGEVRTTIDTSGAGGGGGINLPVNTRFRDVKLTGAFTGAADVRYDRFGLFGDLTYYEIETDKDTTIGSLPTITGDVTVAGTKGMILGYWRAHEDERSSIDLMAGAHYLGVDLDVNVSAGSVSASGSREKNLWDPMVAVRGRTQFGERFGVRGLLAYGGGSSADSIIELQAYGSYRFNDNITALAGYRFYSTDWSDRFLSYDVDFSGPLIGLTFTF